MSANPHEKNLSTADLVAATKTPQPSPTDGSDAPAAETVTDHRDGKEAANQGEQLVALFTPDVASGFRSRWDAVQIGFVDDPRQAVQKADELVAQVMASLAETFAKERSALEGFVKGTDQASTENLRVALRRYRSFFQRLLSL
ncbi:MAG TPA: hypothetical protein VKI18_04340 [Albitalea sp.]|nr:hypothetical protein [Albitalea sp.]